MSINQDIRYAPPSTDQENPESLFSFIKPARWIFNTTDPLPNTGEDQWFFTNITTGDFFIKTLGTWTLYYNFQTGTPSPGITNIQNDGVVGWFKSIIGSTAHFKGISSLSGKITTASLTNDIDLSVNLVSSDVGLGRVQNIKSNFFGIVPPTALNDSSPGQDYSVGSFWLNRGVNPSVLYICESANLAAASWVQIGGSGSGITIINNLPGSAGVFRDIVGTTANFKALNSTSNKITFVNNANSVDFGVSLVKADVGLNLVENTQSVFRSIFNPGPTNDASEFFVPGNLWANYALGTLYMNRTNTVNAAVWDFIGPSSSFMRNDNDFCYFNKGGTNDNTSFTSSGVNVLLNIGFSTYTLVDFRGSWAAQNQGFGPVVMRLNMPTDGRTNDRYLITYDITCDLPSFNATERHYIIGMALGNGSTPSLNVITGSTSDVIFVANQFLHSTVSCSFVYTAPSNGASNFFMIANNQTDTTSLFTSKLRVMFQQI